MGFGKYSELDREIRATKFGYKTKASKDIFKEVRMNKEMNPKGVDIRESRDSDEHPESFPIILGLDETKSMGVIPHYLIKNGLPNIMSTIQENGLEHPQVLFMGIGDHRSDSAPLQIGQFETNDELMDKWLTNIWLEGRGGRNGGESYFLSWYFAAFHTSIDSFEIRNKKGILITIGDEPTHNSIEKNYMKKIMGSSLKMSIEDLGEDLESDDWDDMDDWNESNEVSMIDKDEFTSIELLEEARKYYDVYHIHTKQTIQGKKQETIDGWTELIGENYLKVAENKEEIPGIISDIIINN